MVFVSGIHGVGKSYFTEKVKMKYGIESLTASTLIAEFSKMEMKTNKNVDNIVDNQNLLIGALKYQKKLDKDFILDGHFCLLDKNGDMERIEFNTFQELSPKAIVLLLENSEVIAKRRLERDGIAVSLESIQRFQHEEKEYAMEVASQLDIPIFVSRGSIDLEQAIEFIYIIHKEGFS